MRRGGDEERREVPACGGGSVMWRKLRTCSEGKKKHTHPYWVLIMGVNCAHLDVGGDRTMLLVNVCCMRAQENVELGHT